MKALPRISRPTLVVVFGMLVYCILMSTACHIKFSNYLYSDFDLAVHAQSLHSIVNGSTDCSILGIPFLGNHMVLILFLLAPLYALFPSALLLLYVQAAALASGAWLVYVLAEERLDGNWAAVFSILYLAYPPLVCLNLYEFHPVALAVPFLLAVLYTYRTERFRMFVLFLLLAMACQENIALIAVAFSFYALLDRRKGRWFFTPFVSGILYFCIATGLIMPRLNDKIQFLSLYSHLGDSLPEIAVTILRHPVKTIAFMLTPQKLAFVGALLTPLACLSLVSPGHMAPALLVAVQRLLSSRASEASIAYHYQAEFIPFIFMSAIYGAGRLLKLKKAVVRPALKSALMIFPILALTLSGLPQRMTAGTDAISKNRLMTNRKNRILESIPESAAVAATFDMLPKLANRPELHSVHHIYSGYYTLSDAPYPIPEVDYLLIDRNDKLTFSHEGFYSADGEDRLQALVKQSELEMISRSGSLEVYAKP